MSLKLKKFLINTVKAIAILGAFFFISLAINTVFNTYSLIPPLYVLAVLLISMNTDGYFYGIAAALISVLAVNYAFTFPYFAFNFTIHENIISAIILICVTMATSALTTKIKHHEKMRLQAEKEKVRADLLRAISHDIRTPLTTIYGSASAVVENYEALSDEKKLDILSSIQQDSRWLIRMVENLLSVTRIDNSNLKLTKNPVVLEELVSSALSKFKKSYPGQIVEVEMPEDFIIVSADPILIEQVLMNLLENAVLHAEGMTKLRLRIYINNSNAVFEVADNGCGIEREKLKKIFTDCYMTNDVNNENQKRGMGIGLSVCASIIKAHGGTISAQSSKRDGTVFRFTLALEEEIYE